VRKFEAVAATAPSVIVSAWVASMLASRSMQVQALGQLLVNGIQLLAVA
jgi:hypothetical protein